MKIRNLLRFLVPVCLTTLFATAALSQVSFQLGAGGGLRAPAGSCSGSTMDYYAGYGYGLAPGFTFQAKSRADFSGFTLVGAIEYGRMSNSGEAEPGRGWMDISQSIFTVKAGPEARFSTPGLPFTPYIGANLAWHAISGKATFIGVSRVPSGTFDIETVSRMGIGFNAGAVIGLGAGVSLDLGMEYALVNLLGKDWRVVVPTDDERLNSYLSLNDGRDPFYAVGDNKHFVRDTRSISMFQMTATLMFRL